MRATLVSLGLVAMVAIGGVAGWQVSRWADGVPMLPQPVYQFRSEALQLEQVRQLGELVSLEVPVSDVQTSSLEGYTGSVSLVLLVKGSVLIGTDLDQAALDHVNAELKTAVLTLPPPQATRPRLDHERTAVYRSDRTGLWRLFPTPGAEAAVYDRAMKQAQTLIEAAADQPDLIARARQRTAEVLTPFFEALGWQVQLRWTDQPDQATAAAPSV